MFVCKIINLGVHFYKMCEILTHTASQNTNMTNSKDTTPIQRWELVHKLKAQKQSTKEIAATVGVSQRTVQKILKRAKPLETMTNKGGRSPIFSAEDDAAIKVIGGFYYKCGIPLSTTSVLKIAKDYYRKIKKKELTCGRETITRLMTRIGFKIGKANRLCQQRFRSYDKEIVDDYIKMMRQCLIDAKLAEVNEYGVFIITRPELLLNIDETSVTTGFTKQPKCWFMPGANRIVEDESDKKSKNITALAIITMSGEWWDPLVIHYNKTISTADLAGGMKNVHPMANGAGWITGVDLMQFCRENLIPMLLKRLSEDDLKNGVRPVIMWDNHCTHVGYEILELFDSNGITIMTFPPGGTTSYQMLDCGYSRFYIAWIYEEKFENFSIRKSENSKILILNIIISPP